MVSWSQAQPKLRMPLHLFSGAQKTCGLRGVYTLQDERNGTRLPLIYLTEVADDTQASEIHRLVWNQNVVPFLLVSTPRRFCLYSGFRYRPDKRREDRPLEESLKDATEALRKFAEIKAEAIADGRIWDRWGRHVSPETRVDWTLLSELEKLSDELRNQRGLNRHAAHALIGRYVFLHYLRDRSILSDSKLREWELDVSDIRS
ncbi:MAG: hypothetical protein R3F37_02335 [Candidatus Competibacteraceae bacterium]